MVIGFKNQLRILVPETDFLEIIAAGDSTVIHAVAASINQEDSISNEINNNRHFPVIKMTTTSQFNVVVVAVEVAVISTPVVAAEAASTIQEAALIILAVTEDLTIRAVVSTIPDKAVSINQVVVSIKNLPSAEVGSAEVVSAVVVSAVVVIMVDPVEVVSAVASAMLLIVHHHPTTKDTIQISMIFTIMLVYHYAKGLFSL